MLRYGQIAENWLAELGDCTENCKIRKLKMYIMPTRQQVK